MSKSRRSNRNTQIVIVDDHRVLCQGLCEMLRRERGFKVSGTAHDAEAAKEIIARVTPDIVLLGDSVPRWAVSTATRYIRKVSKGSPVRLHPVRQACSPCSARQGAPDPAILGGARSPAIRRPLS